METKEKIKTSAKELESMIDQAVKKLGRKKENDICRFIPADKDGYIHHFTMRKMKNEDPDLLAQLIQKYILNVPQPKPVAPKQRAPRGSRKRPGQVNFSKQDIDQLLNLARKSGNRELIRKLSPKRDLRNVKRELIASIRHSKVEQDLWDSYVEAVHNVSASEEKEPAFTGNNY